MTWPARTTRIDGQTLLYRPNRHYWRNIGREIAGAVRCACFYTPPYLRGPLEAEMATAWFEELMASQFIAAYHRQRIVIVEIADRMRRMA